LSDSSIAHDGAHRIKQAIGYPFRAVASVIEEDFAAATDAGLSCIHRCFGDRQQGGICPVQTACEFSGNNRKRHKS